ncbi:MAG: type II toxin-antitoxin system RelE/ParE family toxin [bacterium]|nr:type II toxin-antitoxin system RelE/ParE family toxin [bacterium]
MSARWEMRFPGQAVRDVERLSPRLRTKLRDILLEVLAQNPYEGKKLFGDLAGSFSYRLTYRDRIVYSLDEDRRILYVERARTHYGD